MHGQYQNDRGAGKMVSLRPRSALLFLLACLFASGVPIVRAEEGESGSITGGDGSNSDDPIVLHDGSVTEEATDLELPGVTFGWRHHRVYSSGVDTGAASRGRTENGATIVLP